eukprot:gene19131-biopygen11632
MMSLLQRPSDRLVAGVLAIHLTDLVIWLSGGFVPFSGAILALDITALALLIGLIRTDRSVWANAALCAQGVTVLTLIVRSPGDPMVSAAWSAAHAPAFLALLPGLVVRFSPRRPAPSL